MSMVSDLALEVIGEADFAAADCGIVHVYIAYVKASFAAMLNITNSLISLKVSICS